jgi:glucose-1-phosphate thymidylyltransferase
LNPLTRVTNKHLLPIYDKPMVYYPIQTLVNAGIEEILLVTGGKNAGDFLRLLGNGRDFGLKHLNYTYQEGEGGIAEALGLAEFFAGDESICVVLGDNIIENNIRHAVENFKSQNGGAKILLKEVEDAQRFGVAEVQGKRVVGIEEKPKAPKSNYAVIGIYLYDKTVFQKIRRLKPSGRGELEITDVNNFYIDEDKLTYEVLDGWWTDAGTFESLLRANSLVAETGANKMTRPTGAGRQENIRHRWRWIYRLQFHHSRSGPRQRLFHRQLRQIDLRRKSRQPGFCRGQSPIHFHQRRYLRPCRRGSGYGRLRDRSAFCRRISRGPQYL